MFGRKSMPAHLVPAWEAFQAQAGRVEAARQALLGCLPVGRVDPAPVPVGLDLLHDELTAVGGALEHWRVSEVEDVWLACAGSLREALEAIPAAHRVAGSSGELEELLGAVSDVVEPLDAWSQAERRWLRLRSRDTKRPRGPGAPGAVS